MFYRALGWTVWHGGKYFLRRKYAWYLPGKFYIGAAAVGAGAVALLVARNHASES